MVVGVTRSVHDLQLDWSGVDDVTVARRPPVIRDVVAGGTTYSAPTVRANSNPPVT
jgi:hypothetical protein